MIDLVRLLRTALGQQLLDAAGEETTAERAEALAGLKDREAAMHRKLAEIAGKRQLAEEAFDAAVANAEAEAFRCRLLARDIEDARAQGHAAAYAFDRYRAAVQHRLREVLISPRVTEFRDWLAGWRERFALPGTSRFRKGVPAALAGHQTVVAAEEHFDFALRTLVDLDQELDRLRGKYEPQLQRALAELTTTEIPAATGEFLSHYAATE